MGLFIVEKVLNNNVLIAEHNQYKEVVLIGKGIGFNRKKGDTLSEEFVEKIFTLKDKVKQEQFKNLLPRVDGEAFDAIIDALEYIRRQTHSLLNEHIHVALTDHLIFSIYRTMKGISIKNPFLYETKAIYPFEYQIASEVVEIVNRAVNIQLPEDEIGFIALHIHSAINNKTISDVNKHSQLISNLVDIIEKEFQITLDKSSIEYMRLVRHLRFTIDREHHGDELEESSKISSILQTEYPFCYNLAWKLIKIMQNMIKKPFGKAEAVYLTMHLQQIQNKYKR